MNGYLFAAYVVIWTILFFYLLYLNKRQREVAERLETVSERLKDANRTSRPHPL